MTKKEKTVYILGCPDGILGVYTTIQGAYDASEPIGRKTSFSLSHVRKVLNESPYRGHTARLDKEDENWYIERSELNPR